MAGDDRNRTTSLVLWATVGLIVGVIFGALGGGVLLTELSKTDAQPTGSSVAFGQGFTGGGIAGGLAGLLLAVLLARRRAGRQPIALSPDEARARFELRMGIRRGAWLANVVGLVAYFMLRGSNSPWAYWFVGLWFLGSIGLLVGSRCPSCGRFLDASAVQARACKHCNTSFG